MRNVVAAAAAMGIALSLAPSAPVMAQSLTIGIQNEPSTLDPQWNLLGNNTAAARNIYDTLSARDQTLQLVPSLALSWKTIDDTTWEYKLRPGVRFHDGSPFTADDVKFTLARIPTLAGNPNSYAVYTGQIKEVQVVDPLTVRFVTNGPAPLLPTNLSNVFMLSGAKGAQASGEFNAGRAAIGTGPFKLVSWSPGNPLNLARNAEYWGAKPHWETVRIQPIPRDPARVAALLSGDVDFINRVPIADVARLRTDAKLKLFSGVSSYVYMIYPELESDTPAGVRDNAGAAMTKNPFKDPRVRQAMSLAVNRPALVDRVMDGLAVAVSQPVPEGFFGHSPRVGPVTANPERARALLAEAGYPQGFQVELSCPNDRFANDARICEAVAQQFARIGLKATVSAMPSAVFFPRRAKREFGLTMAGWGSLTGESSYFLGAVIHSPNKELGLGAINTSGISEPDIDKLIQAARPVLDDAKRRGELEQIMDLTIARNLVIPTLAFEVISAGRADKLTYKTRADEETLAAEILPAAK